ncbi:GMC family oxidoreductase [Streptomyces lushanensis]|uniref:GMC family oxidoreductase n=1 Tax=Streptomyces lushanensis TaxID=1434255 RepID=UPI000830F311|nr:GMC family oxidoreductase N-terminal domain-containing protein [Streptomyces lushanensis]
MASTTGYDYVVVGAGTAGCVLAARLTEDENVRVLLIEAGARDPLELMAVPGAWPELMGSSADWGGLSVVQASTGSAIPTPRGRGLGGSSSINGLNFIRGHRSSYDVWPEQGATGWGFDDLLPYMRRSERARGHDPALRGMDGPLTVGPPPEPNPLVAACVDAAVETGHTRADDISGGLETGFGWCDNNIADGVRQSAADAYLRPVMDRANLDVVTDALVLRLMVTDDRCRGVEYAKDGETRSVECAEEVVVTAGAIGSAQLLLLSGIGPADHLRAVGVDVVLDLPGVGANLHDHPMSTLTYTVRRPVPRIMSNPPGEAMGMVRTGPGPAVPDLQILFASLPYRAPSLPGPDDGYTIAFSAVNPRSRGTVRLASAEPGTAPLVDPDYLGDGRDIETMATGLRAARRIGEADALSAWRDEEVLPGPGTTGGAAFREYLGKSLLVYYHYVGTCRIGPEGTTAVVDPRLRVRGVTGLRVADASVMPSIVNSNTNAAVYAIAERAAALIKEPTATVAGD